MNNNQNMGQYLDQDVPIQQLDNELLSDEPAFIYAQLDSAKSKQGKKVKLDKRYYQMKYRKKRGEKND